MGQEIDSASASQDSLANGSSIDATVESGSQADTVTAFVDDNGGGTPASYDITFDVTTPDGTSMQHTQTTGSTARQHSIDGVPDTTKVTVTNQSGAAANFRVIVVSHR